MVYQDGGIALATDGLQADVDDGKGHAIDPGVVAPHGRGVKFCNTAYIGRIWRASQEQTLCAWRLAAGVTSRGPAHRVRHHQWFCTILVPFCHFYTNLVNVGLGADKSDIWVVQESLQSPGMKSYTFITHSMADIQLSCIGAYTAVLRAYQISSHGTDLKSDRSSHSSEEP